MRKIIPLIFSLLSSLAMLGQANGGWGTCEFTTVAAMNAFDPSGSNFSCKKVYVQATDEHYYWDGSAWVQVTDDQIASEVPFTPAGTISSTDVQAAIEEIEPDIYGSIDVHSDVDVTTTPPSSGDLLIWDGSNFVPQNTDNGYTIFNIWAEESAALAASSYEWAFGNGDNTPNGDGIVIPVDCELFAMSLNHEGGSNTIVRIVKNTDASQSTYQVQTSGTENGYNTFGTPLSFSAGDIANFTTISASAGGTSGRVSAWFRIRSTPASTSLLNDLLDVSAGSIASGEILQYNGASFVPLSLSSYAENIYNTSDTLTSDRTLEGDANSLFFEGLDSMYIEGTNIELDASNILTFFAANTIEFELDATDGKGIYIASDGDVGIGTSSPDAKLDVEGGSVRFTDYGTGTYEDTTAVYLLGVESDGDVIEMNTAKSSRIFYPPALVIDASSTGTSLTLDLHQQYLDLFGSPAVASSGAPSVIPTYAETELYYYVTDYDNTVFSNLSISAAGVLTYDIDTVPTDNCSVLNVVFVVK